MAKAPVDPATEPTETPVAKPTTIVARKMTKKVEPSIPTVYKKIKIDKKNGQPVERGDLKDINEVEMASGSIRTDF